MAKLTPEVEEYIRQSTLAQFTEPITANELAERLNLNYFTANKRIKKYVHQNLLVFSHRDSQHRNVYKLASADNSLRIFWGYQGTGAPHMLKADVLVSESLKHLRTGKPAILTSYSHRFIRELLAYLIDRVRYAKSEEMASESEDDPMRDHFRTFLSDYLAEIDRTRERVQQLLDHPFLWSDGEVFKWGRDFPDEVVTAYEKWKSDSSNRSA